MEDKIDRRTKLMEDQIDRRTKLMEGQTDAGAKVEDKWRTNLISQLELSKTRV